MTAPYTLEQVKDLNLFSFLKNTAKKMPNNKALAFVGEDFITYKEFENKVKKLSYHLQLHGINKGDKVAIWSENSPNWLISYFAIVAIGGIAVPVLPDFSTTEVENILKHSEAKVLFVSPTLYRKLYIEDTMVGKTIILLSDFTMHIHKKDEVKKESDFSKFCEENKGEIDDIKFPDVKSDELASIIYTSGTTGTSKGVMLTHANLIANTIQGWNTYNTNENDRGLSLLPMSHTLEFTLGNLLPVMCGYSISYLQKPPTASVMMPALKSVRPTIMLTVPLIIEKIYKSKIRPELTKSATKKFLYENVPFMRKIMHKMAGKQLYSTFGGSLGFFGIGGAKLDHDVERFLFEADFPYAIGYGLTETSPLIAGTWPHNCRVGSCGPAIHGVTLKLRNIDPITKEGEIIAYGPNVMQGYYNDPEKTAEVFTEDGGFITGDTGIFDKDNYLHIKGRIKNMILGPSGENIFPEEIEAAINKSEWVLESLVYELKGKVVARVELNQEEINKQFKNMKNKAIEMEKEVADILASIRKSVNVEVSRFSRLTNIFEQKEPFVKTPTKKIKRFLYKDKEAHENPEITSDTDDAKE